MPVWLRFLLAVLAVWRITHLLTREDGPWALVARLRLALGQGFWGGLIDCFKCLSVWVAAPFAFFVGGDWIEMLVAWLALSAGAILLEEQLTGPLLLEQGETDELLRRSNNDLPAEAEVATDDGSAAGQGRVSGEEQLERSRHL